MSTQQLPIRDAVPEKLTWDLTTIFKNDAAFEVAFKKVKTQLPTLKTLDRPFESADQLVATIEQILATFRQLETIYVYASMKNDQDTANATYQGYQAQVDSLAAEVSA
ncbi:MAG: oligoendopeptidase F, partial [Latilactobacillus curvatus]